MHKGVILLLKADNREDVRDKVEEFMKPYGDGDVWDWWKIGGRWMNLLAPMDKVEAYEKEEKRITGYKDGNFGISSQVLETKRDELQKVWEDLGLKGKQPNYYNGGFNFDMPEEGEYYDILLLKDCIDKVKDWSFDYWERHEKLMEEAKQWLEGTGKGMYDKIKEKKPDTWYKETERSRRGVYAYCLKNAAEIAHQDFSFECNVYNIETYDYRLPADSELEGWWACIVDMHN